MALFKCQLSAVTSTKHNSLLHSVYHYIHWMGILVSPWYDIKIRRHLQVRHLIKLADDVPSSYRILIPHPKGHYHLCEHYGES